MAYFEFRKFNFFDLIPNVDSGKIAESLKDVRVTVTTSGYGFIVLGDSDGNVHLVNKNFEIRSFRAYERNISLVSQAKHSPYLITIGEDEMGINPVIKVWSLEASDKSRQGRPVCLRVSRCTIPNKAVIPSCLAINDDLTFMAVGFADGSIIVYRGDVKRERTSKQKLLYDRAEDLSSITGLAFQTLGKNTYLYVSTLTSVEMYDITHKDKENKMILDNVGCSLGCSVLAESAEDEETHFIVATDEVIFFYTNGVKGSCQIISGEKIQLAWYRNYLVIAARDNKGPNRIATASSRQSEDKDSPILSVLDLRNKIMAFTDCLKEVSVLVEWGSIYAVTSDNTISAIAEIDLQSKLTLLFKKNLYDIGIRMAKDQQYDSEGLMEIFRQYGDYLYTKGDHKTAIEQYIKTIGYLEPSYIIRKYRDSQKVDILPVYLEALHKAGKANGDHTTLLLNCYTKLNKTQLLKEFIRSEEKVVNFDVRAAIEVCRHVALEDALFLAEKHGFHEWFLAIQIEDRKNYDIALDYIMKLNFEQAEPMMKKYCSVLLENIPDKTTDFLKTLCTNYKSSSKPTLNENPFDVYSSNETEKSNPSDFVHYFFNNSKKLVEFLTHIIQVNGVGKCDGQVYTQLLEHYLSMWAECVQGIERTQYQHKIMGLLESRDTQIDKLQAMVLCKAANFTEGLLYLYEQNKMYQAILNHHLANCDYTNVLQVCKRLDSQEPKLWLQALWSLVRLPYKQDYPNNILEEILSYIDEKKLLSPLLVVDALCTSTKVGDVRKYLNLIFQKEDNAKKKEQILIERYKTHMDRIKTVVEDIQFRPMVFQGLKCATCDKQLCFPSIHFLCQHSYHQDCYQSFAENENECLRCLPKNRQILEAISAQDQTRGLAEDFHSQLELADDGFSLVTNYLGRGVFNKPANISEIAMRAGIVPLQSKSDNFVSSFSSNNSKDNKTSYTVMGQKFGKGPVEDAMKSQDFMDLSAHFSEPTISRPSQLSAVQRFTDQVKSDTISASVTAPGNPFEDSPPGNPFLDNTGNPFDDSGKGNPFEDSSGNPFSDEDDYN